jgi:hypothetical protein
MTPIQSQHMGSTANQTRERAHNGAEPMGTTSKVIATLTVLAGVTSLVIGFQNTNDIEWLRLATFTVVVAAAATLKVKLPGMESTMSVNLPFILLAAAELNLFGVLIVASVSTLVQSTWNLKNRVRPVQIAFNVSVIALAAHGAWRIFHYPPQSAEPAVAALYLSLAAAGYFVVNTAIVAAMVSSVQLMGVGKVWGSIFTLTFPYYILSAGLAVTSESIGRYAGWQTILVMLAVMFGVFSSYRLYFGSRQPADERLEAAAAARG